VPPHCHGTARGCLQALIACCWQLLRVLPPVVAACKPVLQKEAPSWRALHGHGTNNHCCQQSGFNTYDMAPISKQSRSREAAPQLVPPAASLTAAGEACTGTAKGLHPDIGKQLLMQHQASTATAASVTWGSCSCQCCPHVRTNPCAVQVEPQPATALHCHELQTIPLIQPLMLLLTKVAS
jgi:hypothetical protein